MIVGAVAPAAGAIWRTIAPALLADRSIAVLRELSAPAPAIAPAFSTRVRPPVRSRIAVALAPVAVARIAPVLRMVGTDAPVSISTALVSAVGAPPPVAVTEPPTVRPGVDAPAPKRIAVASAPVAVACTVPPTDTPCAICTVPPVRRSTAPSRVPRYRRRCPLPGR
ncbi:hypothetical protein P0F65_07605 [Sphingomonas sp. I4]